MIPTALQLKYLCPLVMIFQIYHLTKYNAKDALSKMKFLSSGMKFDIFLGSGPTTSSLFRGDSRTTSVKCE